MRQTSVSDIKLQQSLAGLPEIGSAGPLKLVARVRGARNPGILCAVGDRVRGCVGGCAIESRQRNSNEISRSFARRRRRAEVGMPGAAMVAIEKISVQISNIKFSVIQSYIGGDVIRGIAAQLQMVRAYTAGRAHVGQKRRR